MAKTSPYDDAFEEFRRTFHFIDTRALIMYSDLSTVLLTDLGAFGAIFLGGGNTFCLMDYLRTSKFGDALITYALHGGVIYGESAGAIILGKTILTAAHEDANDAGVKDFNGLSIIGACSVWCHYQDSHDATILDFCEQNEGRVIAIPDEAGVDFHDDSWNVVGTRDICVFNTSGKEVFHPGQAFACPSTGK